MLLFMSNGSFQGLLEAAVKWARENGHERKDS